MGTPIRKAVFPVAGLGTRFLPATKVMAKEMLTVVDRPLIQYTVEECVAAGIEEFVFVTGRGKSVLVDHFDHAYELEATLQNRNKLDELEALRSAMPGAGQVIAVRQQVPLGLGHAVWCARDIIGDDPFAVVLPDELFLSQKSAMAQLVEAYERTGGNLVTVMDVPREHTSRYGILDVAEDDGVTVSIKGLVEKPKPEEAPSTLSITGRYILQPEIFEILAAKERGAGGEIQLTDAMAKLLDSQPFYGVRPKGERYDCGSKLGFLQANVAFALAREDDIAAELKGWLSGLKG